MQLKTSSSEAAATTPTVRKGASFGLINRTLFRKNLTRFWPLWAIYTIIWGVMMPLIQYSTYHSDFSQAYYTRADLSREVLTMASSPAVTMALIFGCLFAMALFSYLCAPRSVGMMHSFPIRREGLFLTSYLSGLFMMCLTNAVIFLLTALVQMTGGNGLVAWGALGLWLAVTCCLSVFFFSFAVFCTMFTGQILAIPAFYGILNILVIGVEWLVRTFAGLFLYGIDGSGGYSETAMWLSPVVYLYSKLQIAIDWGMDHQVSRVYLPDDGLRGVWVFAAAGVVLAALALIAYRRRRSETAGDTVSVGWAKPIFKYGVAACSALGLGQGLYFLTWGRNLGSADYSLPGVLVCMLLMGVVGYFAAEMLLMKSFRVWKAAWKGAVVLVAVLALFSVAMSFDLLNVEGRVPDAAKVESVRMTVSGENYLNFETEDADLIEEISAAHREIVAEKEDQRPRTREYRYADDGDDYRYTGVNLTYTLTYGSVIKRNYDLYYSAADVKTSGGAAGLLTAICSEPRVQLSGLFSNRKILDVTGGDYGYFIPDGQGGTYHNLELSSEQGRTLYQAVLEDVAAGRFGGNSIAQDPNKTYACNLNLYCLTTNNQDRIYNSSINLSADSTATIAALKELGLVTEQRPFVTQEQANRDGDKMKGDQASAATEEVPMTEALTPAG